jgi:hypothetical protein
VTTPGDALFPPPRASASRGPIYQGVCKQIRTLFPPDADDTKARKARYAGTIAQCRELARNLDTASGHGTGKPWSGTAIAQLHGQLDLLLERLAGEEDTDEWDRFAEELSRGSAARPHP